MKGCKVITLVSEATSQHSALWNQHADLPAQLGSLQENHDEPAQQHRLPQRVHSALQQSSQSSYAQEALNILQKEHDVLRHELATRRRHYQRKCMQTQKVSS